MLLLSSHCWDGLVLVFVQQTMNKAQDPEQFSGRRPLTQQQACCHQTESVKMFYYQRIIFPTPRPRNKILSIFGNESFQPSKL